MVAQWTLPGFFLTLLAASTFFAQSPTPNPQNHPITCNMSVSFLHVGAVAGPTTPFSAIQESTQVQTLSDGTHVSYPSQTERIYRDSQGRVRTDRPICAPAQDDPEAWVVEIRDPVAGYAYLLDMHEHVAHRYAGAARQGPQIQAAAPVHTGVVVIDPGRRDPRAGFVEPVTTESLGSQTMEGVYVEGTRSIHMIAEGAEGNDRPIMTVHERWYSPDLKVTVVEKNTDPRSGEHTIRLTNINTSEPDPALFQIPPDYKVVDETDRVTIRFSRP